MKLKNMSDEATGISVFLTQFKPEILAAINNLSFEDWKDIYRSLKEPGKKEKECLVKIMTPLAKSPAEKRFLREIRKSLQGG